LPDRLALRPREAAEALGISERTLRKWMRSEGLPHFRLDGAVLIPLTGVRAWIEQRVATSSTSDEMVDEVLRAL
jgi:excisionase family DNA binding protein